MESNNLICDFLLSDLSFYLSYVKSHDLYADNNYEALILMLMSIAKQLLQNINAESLLYLFKLVGCFDEVLIPDDYMENWAYFLYDLAWENINYARSVNADSDKKLYYAMAILLFSEITFYIKIDDEAKKLLTNFCNLCYSEAIFVIAPEILPVELFQTHIKPPACFTSKSMEDDSVFTNITSDGFHYYANNASSTRDYSLFCQGFVQAFTLFAELSNRDAYKTCKIPEAKLSTASSTFFVKKRNTVIDFTQEILSASKFAGKYNKMLTHKM